MIGLWSKIKTGLALAGAFFIALGIAFLKGRAEGKRVLQAEQDRARLNAMKHRKDVDDEIDSLGHADIDSELAKWLRDDPER